MLKNSNKKGQIGIVLTTAGLIIIGVIILMAFIAGGLILHFITHNIFLIAGIGVLIFGMIFAVAKTDKPLPALLVVVLLAGGLIGLNYIGLTQQTSFQGKEVTLLVPHQAGIKCEVIDDVVLTYSLPESGFWISKENIGFKSKVVSDIQYFITYGFWESLGKDLRIVYKVCDANRNNCGQEHIIKWTWPGEKHAIFSSIDVSQNSMYIKLEKYTLTSIFTGWKPASGGTLTYNAEKYGLNLYSTTGGFRTICYTGCDLNCPTQSIRDVMVETSATTLNFYESTNYIEFWDEPAYVGEQFGGTIWDSSKQEFCFGGYIYSAGTITTETGKTYLYPATYTGHKACCNGARIDITNGYKICENNNWRTVAETDTLACTSSVECPGQGLYGGQLINGQTYKVSYSCSSGKCVQNTPVKVVCIPPNIGCAQDQVCQDFKCVGGNIQGIPTNVSPEAENPPVNAGECEWYQEFVSGQELHYRWWNYIGIGKPVATTYNRCITAGWVYLAIGGIILTFIIIIIAASSRGKKNSHTNSYSHNGHGSHNGHSGSVTEHHYYNSSHPSHSHSNKSGRKSKWR